MTGPEEELLHLLVEYVDVEGFPPSVQEMASVLCVSTSTVHLRLKVLDELGLIRVRHGQARAIDVRPAREAGYGIRATTP